MTRSGTLSEPTMDRTRCAHPTRVRENHWGWASTETVCSTCGQAFNPDEEARLRRQEASPRTPSHQREPHRRAHRGPDEGARSSAERANTNDH